MACPSSPHRSGSALLSVPLATVLRWRLWFRTVDTELRSTVLLFGSVLGCRDNYHKPSGPKQLRFILSHS